MSIRPFRDIKRRKTKKIKVGKVEIGGDAPISVQSMTNTLTTDVDATIKQINELTEAGADIVGVNNRDLRTSAVDLEASEVLMREIPQDVTAVAESGLTSASDLIALRRAGYHAFLIGGAFMSTPVPGEALANLLRDTHQQMTVSGYGAG